MLGERVFYFTRNWPPEAIYSGRFAFVQRITSESAKRRLIEAWELSSDHQVDEAIVEEMKHARLFLRSVTGMTLSGARFLVRSLWVIFHWKAPVASYYHLRTHFYRATYAVHERTVSSQGESLPSDSLLGAEATVLHNWLKYLPLPTVALLTLSPLLLVLGWLVAREPTIVTTKWDGMKLHEQNHSLRGLFNVVGSEPMARESALRRQALRILSYFQIERLRKQAFDDDLDWVRIKAQVETQHYDYFLASMEGSEFSEKFPMTYREYFELILAFVVQWIPSGHDCQRDALRIQTASRLVFDQLQPKDWMRNDPVIRKLVNFCYLHGN